MGSVKKNRNQYSEAAIENRYLFTRGEKRCSRCRDVKPLTAFHADKTAASGYCSYCKACDKLRYKNKKHNTPAKYVAQRLCADIRKRAKEKGLPFDLDVPFLETRLLDGHCEVTGLDFKVGIKIANPFSPSVDRINPSLGYIKENCRMVCMGFNALRGIGSDEDAFRIAIALVRSVSLEKVSA